jgi:hypothetical protein
MSYDKIEKLLYTINNQYGPSRNIHNIYSSSICNLYCMHNIAVLQITNQIVL